MEPSRLTLRKNLGPMSRRGVSVPSSTSNRKNYSSVVGEEESDGSGIVVAILFDQTRSLYLVCTPYRGVISGSPILVGEHEVRAVSDFAN